MKWGVNPRQTLLLRGRVQELAAQYSHSGYHPHRHGKAGLETEEKLQNPASSADDLASSVLKSNPCSWELQGPQQGGLWPCESEILATSEPGSEISTASSSTEATEESKAAVTKEIYMGQVRGEGSHGPAQPPTCWLLSTQPLHMSCGNQGQGCVSWLCA